MKLTDVPEAEQKEIKHPDTEVVSGEPLLVDQVAQLFDMRPNEITREMSKLNTLIDYAKSKTDDHTPEGIKWAIRSLSLKLGTPPMGEKLLPYLTRFAHLATEKSKIEKEMDKYVNP